MMLQIASLSPILAAMGELAFTLEPHRSKTENEKGHSSRRWCWNASFSTDENRLQTASADLRQTDDLLSAGDFDARRSSRGAHNLDAKRSSNVARLSRRWGATWYSHRVRRAAEARRHCAGISNRCKIYRRLRRVAYSRRQYFLRKTGLLSGRARDRPGRLCFWLSGSRPRTLWRSRVRCGR